MSQIRKMKERKERRALRVRKKIGTDRHRVSVFRSLSQIYAQVIDDKAAKTLVSFSSVALDSKAKGSKKDVAFAVGKELARLLEKEGITSVTFDRGPYLFHGRVKALADGLIEGGITI